MRFHATISPDGPHNYARSRGHASPYYTPGDWGQVFGLTKTGVIAYLGHLGRRVGLLKPARARSPYTEKANQRLTLKANGPEVNLARTHHSPPQKNHVALRVLGTESKKLLTPPPCRNQASLVLTLFLKCSDHRSPSITWTKQSSDDFRPRQRRDSLGGLPSSVSPQTLLTRPDRL
jgi:hypothetical protein